MSSRYGELCLSTETLVGEMIFVAILDWANKASDFRPSVKEKLGSWTHLFEEKDRLKRVYWGINQFTRPMIGVNTEAMKLTFKQQLPTTGICASVREATSIDWPLWSVLTDSSIGVAFNEYIKLITDNSVGCRFVWIKEKTPPWIKLPNKPESLYSSGQAFSMSFENNKEGNSTFMTNSLSFFSRLIHFMPNTRNIVGTILMTVATPIYLKFYDQKLASESHPEGAGTEGRKPATDTSK